MIDLQLPTPLLNPSEWPRGDALFSIDLLKYGGAFSERAAKAFVVPEHFWLRLEEPSLALIIHEKFKSGGIEIFSRTALDKAEESEWRKRGATLFRVDPNLKRPTLLEWSREVFPESYKEAGEVNWVRELREYEQQLGSSNASMDQLRFWPAFLRTKKSFFATTAAREWATAQVLFSPQDDSRGSGPQALLNPTMQITTGDGRMRALWRVDGVMNDHELTWEQAAVLDELRETPRLLRERLRAELEARSFPLKARVPFDVVIQHMIKDGLILLRS